MPFLVIGLIAWAFTKAIFSHRERMAYAKQGMPPPGRGQAAVGPAAAGGEAEAQGAASTGSVAGAGGRTHVPADAPFRQYARTLWRDLWEDARLRHERERQRKRPDGGRTARATIGGWWNWARRPFGEPDPNKQRPGDQGGTEPAVREPAGEQNPTGPKPAPGAERRAAEPVAPAATDLEARFCEDCGNALIEYPDGWWHRDKEPCPVSGAAGPYRGANSPADAAGKPAATPPAAETAEPTKTDVRRCDACEQVLVGPLAINGHVCPQDPQNREPASSPYDPATDSELGDPQARTAHRDGVWCGDPGCGLCLDAGRVPEDQRYSPDNSEQLRRDGAHLAGQMCGVEGCVCVCRTCRSAYAGQPTGQCLSCWVAEANEQEFCARFNPDRAMCAKCGSFRVVGKGASALMCLDCYTTVPVESSAGATNGSDPVTSSAGAAGLTSKSHPSTTNNGGPVMDNIEIKHDEIVERHKAMLELLNIQLEQAKEVSALAGKAAAAADGMDNGRAALVKAAQELEGALTVARYDTDSIAGCVSAAEAFTADDAGVIEEQAAAVKATADRVVAATEASIEAVQASLAHIQSRYAALAEGVQTTGVAGSAMEAV